MMRVCPDPTARSRKTRTRRPPLRRPESQSSSAQGLSSFKATRFVLNKSVQLEIDVYIAPHRLRRGLQALDNQKARGAVQLVDELRQVGIGALVVGRDRHDP